MNPRVKSKWIEALRSGEYPQDKGYLRTDEGFCCIGVLCELAREEGIGEWKEPKDSITDPHIYYTFLVETESGNWTSIAPWTIGDWAGIDINGRLVTNLMAMNDEGFSFEEIANEIEETL